MSHRRDSESTSEDLVATHYQELQDTWSVVDRTQDYARLVVPIGNSAEPVHRWFHMKEAYSSQLIERLRKDEEIERGGLVRTLDPFCGSGTTLISSMEVAGLGETPRTIGVERNPFLATVARAKVAGVLGGDSLGAKVREAIPGVKRRFDSERKIELSSQSSTLSNDAYFPKENVTDLLAISKSIRTIKRDDVRDVLAACLAASVERSGKLRRDGRALRFEADREPAEPWFVFQANLNEAIEDLDGLKPRPSTWKGHVVSGDARHAASLVGSQCFDWIVFSPPYPNNIDYTEVYKLESWVLGAWSTPAEMRSQRHTTLRSHPSVVFKDAYRYESTPDAEAVNRLIDPVIASIPTGRYEKGRTQVVRGYADDMLTVLRQCRRVIAPDGRLVYVVGNSMHGSDSELVIAADLIIARLAELAGWAVEEIRIARALKRRNSGSPFLRESVVVLTPV